MRIAAFGLVGLPLLAVGCGEAPVVVVNPSPANVTVTPSTTPVVVEATLKDGTSEETRTKRLSEIDNLLNQWFGSIRDYRDWHGARMAAHQGVVDTADAVLSKAREAHHAKALALSKLQDDLGRADTEYQAAITAARIALETSVSAPVTYASFTRAHVERSGLWDSLVNDYAAKTAAREVAYDKWQVAREKSREMYNALNALERDKTVQEKESLQLLEDEANKLAEELSKREDDVTQAMNTMNGWKDKIADWIDHNPPSASPDDPVSKEVATTAAAHAKAVKSFLELWNKRQAAVAAVDAASAKLAAEGVNLDKAEDAERDARKAYRTAVTRYDQIDEKVKADETAKAMGSNVQPDYAARTAAKNERDRCKLQMEVAELVKKRAKTSKSDAFKAKNAAISHLKSLEKKEQSERVVVTTSGNTLMTALAPWLKEADAQEALVAAAKKVETEKAEVYRRLTEEVEHAKAALEQEQGTVDAAEAQRNAIGEAPESGGEEQLQQFTKAVSAAISRRLDGEYVREFRTMRFTFPEWPGKPTAMSLYQRLHLAITDPIDGSRQ